MSPTAPLLYWEERDGQPCLRFVFEGVLLPEEAERVIAAWREAFSSRPEERFVLIWDCRAMTGYESEARSAFTDALTEIRSRVSAIWVISASTLVRMGASVIGLATGLEIRAVQDDADIALAPAKPVEGRQQPLRLEAEACGDPPDKA